MSTPESDAARVRGMTVKEALEIADSTRLRCVPRHIVVWGGQDPECPERPFAGLHCECGAMVVEHEPDCPTCGSKRWRLVPREGR